MAFAKATARAKRMMETALPSTPRRRKAVCRQLCKDTLGTENPPSTSKETSRKSSSISDETLQKVKDFYQRDDISQQAPVRKDATSIRQDDGMKVKVQNRHLTSSIMETYAMFKEENPNEKWAKASLQSYAQTMLC